MATRSRPAKPSPVSQRSRASRPSRAMHGVITARGQTFAQATATLSRRSGLHLPPSLDPSPFADIATKAHYAKYDTLAQSRIALALTQPQVIAKANFHNVGTGSELHVLGRFLVLHYVWERELFFQEATLRDFRRSRPFVADIAIRPQGQQLTVLPIDGQAFHARTYAEQYDAQRRNRALAYLGRVLVVPDTVCYRGRDLDSFLNSNRVR